jgi:hypothetical protein
MPTNSRQTVTGWANVMMQPLHLPRTVLAALALVGASAYVAAAGGDPSASPDVIPREDAVLDELAACIRTAVRRTDADYPIFHGCYDWHSAVHGHWALLRLAAATGRHNDDAEWVVAALDPRRLAAEAEYLGAHPSFEMPYGRAWFLRLAIEYESRPRAAGKAGAHALGAMADATAASLWQFCKSRDQSPASREYNNDAWALVQLHEFYRHRRNEPQRSAVANRISRRFVDANSPVRFELDYTRGDFFSPFGAWTYLVAKTQPAATTAAFWRSHRPSDDELRPVEVEPGRDHQLGVNWSRAWALRAASRGVADPAERARLQAAYRQHIAAGLEAHQRWKDNYGAYGHWVPQFAVYAITE